MDEKKIIVHEKIFKAYTGDDPYIFISYNHKDADVVYKIMFELYKRGYRIWYDEGICVGDRFVKVLADKILNCEALFCFLSPHYDESEYCRKELHFALSKKKKIIPIKIEDFELTSDIDFLIAEKHRVNLKNFPSEKELVNHLCEVSRDFLGNCLGEPVSIDLDTLPDQWKKDPGQHEEKPDQSEQDNDQPEQDNSQPEQDDNQSEKDNNQPKKDPVKQNNDTGQSNEKKSTVGRNCIIAGAVIVFLIAAVFIGTLISKPENVSVQDQPSVQTGTEAAQPETQTIQSESDKEITITVKVVDSKDIVRSGKKAKDYLAALTDKGCPLSVYDPQGSEEDEAQFVYDNAIAALAILSESSNQKNRSFNKVKLILDAIVESENNGDDPFEGWDSKSLAAASIAFLQYDKIDTSITYVRAAQRILDHVAEKRRKDDAGYYSRVGTEGGTTEENLWLYAAFEMLYKKTGNTAYSQAADHAHAFVLAMRSGEGEYYLTGETEDNGEDAAKVSAQVQALAELILNDRTGMQSALSLQVSEGGFAPDNKSSGGFGTECTALMSMACGKLGIDEKKEQALSSVYYYQLEDGSIPAGSSASLSDGTGKRYPNVSKTSAAAWYAMAATEYNPFEY